ncbi:MAG: hypothetical protein JWQ79_949 [Mucilaginibacter sp.]|nr:hypothetical protein [Mucilaginibacter sp.]
MASTRIEDDKLRETVFTLHSINFIPYSGSTKKSNDVLFDILNFINKEHSENRAYFIDRYKDRNVLERREMYMRNPVRVGYSNKFKCSIALVRDKTLMVKPHGTFELIPYDKANGSLVDVTHFFIDYGVNPPIMCTEYNHTGPRVSDIEFYFRKLAAEKHVAKGCQITTFLDRSIDKTLEDLHNVLNFEIKIRPQNIAKLENQVKGFITDITTLGQRLKPNFIRVEAMFQTPGVKIKSLELNKEANAMMSLFLRMFQKDTYYIEQFEEFEIKFIDKDGKSDFFNLIKGKREITVIIDRDKHYSTTDYYNMILPEFEKFLLTFK